MSQTLTQTGPETTEEKPALSKRLGLILFAILVLLLAIGGFFWYLHARQYETTDDAFIEGTVVPVSAKVAGRLDKVLVDDNQEVAAGQLLVTIDPRDFEARVQQARAAYEAALARVDVATTNVQFTRANTDAITAQAQASVQAAQAVVVARTSKLESAKADVAAAESEFQRRSADLKRYESLDRRIVTQQQLDAARSAADAAQASLTAVKKGVSTAEADVQEAQGKVSQAQAVLQAAATAPQQIASAEAQAKSAQAAVEQAKAALAAAELDLSYTQITAPTAGRVARKSVQPGQYMQIGQSMLAIVEPDVYVTANFKETQLTHMRTGQEVAIRVDAYPGKEFKGRIQSIQAGTGSRFSLLPPENATGNYVKVVQRIPVKILFDQAGTGAGTSAERNDFLLAPGMSVEPEVFIGTDQSIHPAAISPGK
jgi:membrane fusion protein (multidrug efflux system)